MLKLQWMINVRKPAFRWPSYSGCQPDTQSSLAAVAARWMGGKVSGRAGMLNFCRAGQLSGIRARMPIRARTAGQVWINLYTSIYVSGDGECVSTTVPSCPAAIVWLCVRCCPQSGRRRTAVRGSWTSTAARGRGSARPAASPTTGCVARRSSAASRPVLDTRSALRPNADPGGSSGSIDHISVAHLKEICYIRRSR